MPYATSPDVALFLGRDLNDLQAIQADFLLEAATAWVQRRTGRLWGSTPVVERFRITADVETVHLSQIPASVTSVTAGLDFGEPMVLTDGIHYELYDAAKGIIRLNTYLLDYYDYIEVTYPTGTSIPADIKLATVMLASYWLSNNLDPDRWGYKKYTVGDELAAERELGIPQDVLDILDQVSGGWVLA